MTKSSFHARFTKIALVPRFMPIPVKRETNGHFTPLLPMKDHLKSMKRSPARNQALVSREIGFVSPRFTSRFTPFSHSAMQSFTAAHTPL
jgi:hypothetical protein